jgi:hypothetical protein
MLPDGDSRVVPGKGHADFDFSFHSAAKRKKFSMKKQFVLLSMLGCLHPIALISAALAPIESRLRRPTLYREYGFPFGRQRADGFASS